MHLYPKRGLLEGAEVEIFKLLAYGATPDQWAEWLRAPLEHAAARGNFDLVDRLLKAGANGSAGWRGCRGRTLLDAAAVGGNGDVVTAFLRAGCGPDVSVVSVSSRRSALHAAAVCGHEAAARRLMMAGADINREDPADRCTPLHVAVRGGHNDLVSDLLVKGTSPNTRDERDCTPLHLAATLGQDKVMTTLLECAHTDVNALGNSPGITSLMLACMEGHLSTVKALLAAGADHEKPTSDGVVPLHLAVKHNRMSVVEILLDAGASVHAAHDAGFTPLHTAARYCVTKAIPALLRRGAHVNGTGVAGETALHRACFFQSPGVGEAVDLLLRWGASETATDANGETPAEILEEEANNSGLSVDELNRTRTLLARAPQDRAWRRRCWLAVLRARSVRERTAGSIGNNCRTGSSNETEVGCRRVLDGVERTAAAIR